VLLFRRFGGLVAQTIVKVSKAFVEF